MCKSHLAVVRLLEEKFEKAAQLAYHALTERSMLQIRILTTCDLATLAQAYLGLGKTEQALAYAEKVLEQLMESYDNDNNGADFPHYAYYHCSAVLHQLGRYAAAYDALHAALKILLTRADQISDPTRRQAFLQLEPVNNAIMAAFA